jgi:hypothetical protein
MTEISVAFVSRPEDTVEQSVVTVGSVADHIEVRDLRLPLGNLAVLIWPRRPPLL